jgi:hypothetical protein
VSGVKKERVVHGIGSYKGKGKGRGDERSAAKGMAIDGRRGAGGFD